MTHTMTYLNQPAVQAAIHVRRTYWMPVGNISYSAFDMRRDIVPYYEKFFKVAPTWRILVYSGDTDSAVPFLSTQRWIDCLELPQKSPYSYWHYDGEIAGTVHALRWLTYVTIRGAGHMVPFYSPILGFEFFSNWIKQAPNW